MAGSVVLRAQVPSSTADALGNAGADVRLHTQLYIKDDLVVLYGFSSAEALHLFQVLNGVSGIGPRTALALLSRLGVGPLAEAVATGDVAALSRVPGVGRKSAGRLVLELRGKLPDLDTADGTTLAQRGGDADVVAALMALGYTAGEARAAASADGKGTGAEDLPMPLEERVRRALQRLAG